MPHVIPPTELPAMRTLAARRRISVGAAYYPEYQRASVRDVGRDLDLMKAAGFDTIRVGESVWSTWEPKDGIFDLDWLEPVLDAAHKRGISAILGTPTYAIPMWLATAHPEVVGDTATGRPGHWGARQEVDITNPIFRDRAARVIEMIITRYKDHPSLIGYQVDNEPGFRLLYNRGVFEGFRAHLISKFSTVERLNEEWGLTYWSHRLSDWEELWVPDGNYQPQYDLEWRRYQAQIVTDFIAWQAELVRSFDPSHPERFVTTCISIDQVGVEDVELARSLDISSGNAYYEMQDALGYPSDAPMSPGWIVSGVWAVQQLADLMYSTKQAPFLVTETNAGSIGHSAINSIAYSGQWRQAAWLLVARGARMLEYWNWNTITYGTETYWGGVLPHSGRPGRAYREIAQVGRDMASAGEAFLDAVPDADIAMLYDSDSKFALSNPSQGPFPGPTGFMGDPDSYRQILLPFYRGAVEAGLQVNTVRPAQVLGPRDGDRTLAPTLPSATADPSTWSGLVPPMAEITAPMVDPADFARRRPVLLIPGFYTARDDDAAWLRSYAEAGGHLILGPRALYADSEGRARMEPQPAGMAAAAGAWYEEFTNLQAPITVAAEGTLNLPEGAAGTLWAELLIEDGAEVLARWEHPEWGRHPAVTTRIHGAGRITIVATVPDQRLASAILKWAVPKPIAHQWRGSEAVRVLTSTTQKDEYLAVVHNWSPAPGWVRVPSAVDSLLDDQKAYDAGHRLDIPAWGVAVLRVR